MPHKSLSRWSTVRSGPGCCAGGYVSRNRSNTAAHMSVDFDSLVVVRAYGNWNNRRYDYGCGHGVLSSRNSVTGDWCRSVRPSRYSPIRCDRHDTHGFSYMRSGSSRSTRNCRRKSSFGGTSRRSRYPKRYSLKLGKAKGIATRPVAGAVVPRAAQGRAGPSPPLLGRRPGARLAEAGRPGRRTGGHGAVAGPAGRRGRLVTRAGLVTT